MSARLRSARWPLGALLIALDFWTLSSGESLSLAVRRTLNVYTVGTLVLIVLNMAPVAAWPPALPAEGPASDPGTRLSRAAAALLVMAGAVLLFLAAQRIIEPLFLTDLDPSRADMLVLVREGLSSLVRGASPYQMYHVPWEAPLSYGPALWAPFLLPFVLQMDIRFMTAFGQLFMSSLCFVVAAQAVRRRRAAVAAGLALLGAGILANTAYLDFAVIGHTPSYWPLLAAFSLVWTTPRHTVAAAALLGLLVDARTTMMALVPVFLLTEWLRGERRWSVPLALAAGALLPFLPFLIANPRGLAYAMYGVYLPTIKGFV